MSLWVKKIALWTTLLLSLCSCGVREGLAPVVEPQWLAPIIPAQHRVVHGETLYTIAFRYDIDYRQLARLIRLRPPYSVVVGQKLLIKPLPSRSNTTTSLRRPLPIHPQWVHQGRVKTVSAGSWIWPVHGRIVAGYSPSRGRKGINIAAKKGEAVHAAAAGVVAYAGSGLSGYGNLIIIKHNHDYLTAYGNNARNLVREGQVIQKGQVIAVVGVMERRYWGLHFEMRKMGTPVNPLPYLPTR